MEPWQLECIEKLRKENYSYQYIGDSLGLSINTVKAVCRRRHFVAEGPRKTRAEKQIPRVCKSCGAFFPKSARKDRIFCSDSCRRKWWKSHRIVKKTLDSSAFESVNSI